MKKNHSLDTLHICVGKVDLVNDRNDPQIVPKGQIEVGHSLGLE
jgi:hypothetical protein